jgi:hypothetical protein
MSYGNTLLNLNMSKTIISKLKFVIICLTAIISLHANMTKTIMSKFLCSTLVFRHTTIFLPT